MVAREPVGAVRGDHQHRQRRQRLRERERSSSVASSDHCRSSSTTSGVPLGRDVRERAAHRLEQRRAVGRGGRLAELGQQQRQLRAQRAASSRPPGSARRKLRRAATTGRRERCRRAPARRAGEASGDRRELGGQARLAHAGLAAEQHVAPCPRAPAAATARDAPAPASGRSSPVMGRVVNTACGGGSTAIRPMPAGRRAYVARSLSTGPRRLRKETLMDLYVSSAATASPPPDDLKDAAERSTAVATSPTPASAGSAATSAEESGEVGTVCIYEADSPEAIRAHARPPSSRRRDHPGDGHRRRAARPGGRGGLTPTRERWPSLL